MYQKWYIGRSSVHTPSQAYFCFYLSRVFFPINFIFYLSQRLRKETHSDPESSADATVAD